MTDVTVGLAIELACVAIMAAGAVAWTVRLRALLGRAPAPAQPGARVSIIVPARDEEANLPALLASLRALEPPAHEIIVVDDHSTDATGAIARAAGVTVVVPPPLPTGPTGPTVMGKPWACHAGAQVATGDLLLFTDADTTHAPDSVARAVGALRAHDADLLSVVPTHRIVAAWERLQGAFHLLLLVAAAAGAKATRGERRFSIGQYLLFTRAAYERIGGHLAITGRVAEDLALAGKVADAGLRVTTVHAPGLYHVRMYPQGVAAFVRGWRRSFREGMAAAGSAGVGETIAVVGWLLGLPLFAAIHALGGDATLAAGYGAAWAVTTIEVARRQRAIGALGAASALLYPVAVLAFLGISTLATLDRVRKAPVTWRGRTVPVERT